MIKDSLLRLGDAFFGRQIRFLRGRICLLAVKTGSTVTPAQAAIAKTK